VTLAAIGPSAYWYLARGTGAVSLILLTLSVVIGVMGSVRFSARRWPRFAVDTVHRDVSLLVIVLLVIHIVTSVLDSFAPIAVLDAVVPFASTYRPLWMGLGALSFDILLALAITSLVRRRLGYERWRAIHWLAYACWPIAVLHGLGTGSDTKVWWMLALTTVCVAAVLWAVLVRLARSAPERSPIRTPATIVSVAAPLGLAVFTLVGPLQPGWARQAGTPTSLLAHSQPVSATPVSATTGRPTRSRSAPSLGSFTSSLSGRVTQAPRAGGAVVDLFLKLSGGKRGRLQVRLAGAPLPGGGLSMTGSQVDLIVDGYPSVLAGRIVSLSGEEFLARLRGGAGAGLDVQVRLHIDTQTNRVTGLLDARPPRGTP
jgi:DMSO/TMAO reductase YedYZ heme-binding membrane subunit